MTVIDSSALVTFLLREEGWHVVGEALREGALSPDLVLKETSNAILKRLRRGEMTREEASLVFQALRALVGRALKIEDEKEYVEEAIKISMEKGITVYDAIYIVLSKNKNLTLITADKIQAKVASDEGVKIKLIGTKH